MLVRGLRMMFDANTQQPQQPQQQLLPLEAEDETITKDCMIGNVEKQTTIP